MKKEDKIKSLLRDGKALYHTQDLAVLWGINNPNTLYTVIKRYIKRGVLIKIYKGFYSTKSISEIDPIYLGLSALHRYSYLSTESVLFKKGIIFQEVKYVTLVSDLSKEFKVGDHRFLVRKMKPEYLYNNIGIIEKKASVERAVADMLYFSPDYHFDAKKLIDWQKVKEIKKAIDY
jgi:hypothetical protein